MPADKNRGTKRVSPRRPRSRPFFVPPVAGNSLMSTDHRSEVLHVKRRRTEIKCAPDFPFDIVPSPLVPEEEVGFPQMVSLAPPSPNVWKSRHIFQCRTKVRGCQLPLNLHLSQECEASKKLCAAVFLLGQFFWPSNQTHLLF
jgi:hypothetical protein